LIKFTRYREGKFKDYRKTTDEERKAFGSPWMAIYSKKHEKYPGKLMIGGDLQA